MGTILSIAAMIGIPYIIEGIKDLDKKFKRKEINYTQFRNQVLNILSSIKGEYQQEYNDAVNALNQIPYTSGSTSVTQNRRDHIKQLQNTADQSMKAVNKIDSGSSIIVNDLLDLASDPSPESANEVVGSIKDLTGIELPIQK